MSKINISGKATLAITSFLESPLEKKRRILVILAAIFVFASLPFPIWGLDFILQNGADEVFMRVYFNKITGNLQSLINLSGYFGVHLPFDNLPFEIEAMRPYSGVRTKGIETSGQIPLFPEIKYFKVLIPTIGSILLISGVLKGKIGKIATYISIVLMYGLLIGGLIALKIRNSEVYVMEEKSAFIHASSNPYINPGLWGTVDYYTATVSTKPLLGSFFLVIATTLMTLAVLYMQGYYPVERLFNIRKKRKLLHDKFATKNN